MTFESAKNILVIIVSLVSVFQVFAVLENISLLRGQAYRGSTIKAHYPPLLRQLLPFLFQDRAFQALLYFALVTNVLVALMASFPGWFFDSRLILVQLFFLWMQILRFRGGLNGGSDFFAFHLQIGLAIGLCLTQEQAPKAGLAYIALVTSLSYFRAGVGKALKKKWWQGEALAELLKTSPFADVSSKEIHSQWLKIISAITILAQLLFPFSLILPEALMYGFFAFCFGMHLMNWWILGLHRFLLYWPLGYIAVWAINLEILKFVS
ncbi:MAG: hypothetical protein ACK5RO_10050 [Pseudobdellovibrionaceae bacterium]